MTDKERENHRRIVREALRESKKVVAKDIEMWWEAQRKGRIRADRIRLR